VELKLEKAAFDLTGLVVVTVYNLFYYYQ